MKGSIKLGKISGIKIQIHWTFFLLIAWIFSSYYQQNQNIQEALMGVWFILALFACVVLHELGHALMARRFNIATKQINLLPIGGVAEMEKIPENPIQELWISIAGPLVNVGIALLLFIYMNLSSSIPSIAYLQQLDSTHLIENLFAANIVLAVFNMIPAFPMDGGRVLRAWLSFSVGRKKATKLAAKIGQVLAIGFVILGVFYNFWLIIIGIFIYFGAEGEAKYEKIKSELSGFLVRDILISRFSRLHPQDPLKKAVNLLLNGHEKEFLVVEGNQVRGTVTREDIIRGLKEHGDEFLVKDIMSKIFVKLFPEMQLGKAFEKMINTHHRLAPVFENGILLGVIDIENIEELLMTNSAIKEQLSVLSKG